MGPYDIGRHSAGALPAAERHRLGVRAQWLPRSTDTRALPRPTDTNAPRCDRVGQASWGRRPLDGADEVRSLPAMARARPPKMLPSQPKLSYAFVAADRRYTCDGGQAMDAADATDDDDYSYSDGPLPAVGYSVSMPTLGVAGSRRLPAGRRAATAAAVGLLGSPARRSLSPLRLANAAEPSLHGTNSYVLSFL
eukprot:COSAG01_NODE_4923_length_4615_cov_3.525232_6_plen_194_part_00